MTKELVFVYNAKSGFLNAVTDLIHKSVKPETYGCELCRITFNGVSMDKVWRNYVQKLPLKTTFIHKDEFTKEYPGENMSFPVILIKDENSLTELIKSSEFDQITDIAGLISLLNKRLKELGIN
ncbi:MAG TPA: GTPase [Candidatus Dormibacteraeota bacterium]|nr:GTPase [Candidatus Dormibacteraeota bacterium]